MKIISSKTVGGKKRVVIECEPNEQLVAINPNSHYMTGYPHDAVVRADQLLDAYPVFWCVVEQRWRR